MSLKEKKPASQTFIPLTYLWWIPAIIPLVIVYYNFITSYWTWGLMDDYRMILYPGGVWERFNTLYDSLFKQGRFFPTAVFHFAFFYKVFVNSPLASFFFRFAEVLLTVGIWAYLAVKVTKNKAAAPLFLAVTMPFIRFYDAFYFLSTQEVLGVLFSGFCALFFYKSVEGLLKEDAALKKSQALIGLVFLLLAFTTKEPFVAFGAALGLSFIALWFTNRKVKSILVLGVMLFVFSVLYAVCLKIFVSKAYTASYNVGASQLSNNLIIWAKHIVREHIPWLLIMAGIVIVPVRNKPEHSLSITWARWLGFFSYFCYLGILLPWNASGHYVMPFAPFFAFLVTTIIIQKMSLLKPVCVGILITIAIFLNLHIGGKAIYAHTVDQYDKGNLLIWMTQNSIFDHEVNTKSYTVRCNVHEPCHALTSLSKTLYNKSFPPFKISPKVSEVLKDANTRYYIWQTSAGDQDLRRLGPMWTPVFVSKSWIVFRRMI